MSDTENSPRLLKTLARLRSERRGQVAGFVPCLVLVAIVAGVSAKQPSFLGVASLQDVVVEAAPILLIALGGTLVVLLGGIDLSVAAMASMSSILIALWVPRYGFLGLLFVLATATSCGALQGYLHAKLQIPSFVVTLGGLGIFDGLALRLANATTIPVDKHFGVISWMVGSALGIPVPILIVVAIAGLLMAVLYLTPFGRSTYAMGCGERAALLSGVRTVRVRVTAFALSALLASIAGVMLTARTGNGGPNIADNLLLPAIAAIVVGGTAISGGVGGAGLTLIGGLIVASVTAGTVVIGLNPALQDVIFGAAVIAAAAFTIDRRKIGVIK